MMSWIEKIYCMSRLHAYIWRLTANRIFPDFIPYAPHSPFVLEIGTGQGLGAVYLAGKLKDSRFIAIDYEKDMVEAAVCNVRKQGLSDRIKVCQGNAVALDFPGESFDAVVSIIMLHHVAGYEIAIAEAVRVLKKGGLFLIVDFDFKASLFPRFEILIGRPDSIFTWSEVEEALKKAGFDVLKVKFYGMGMFGCAAVKL
jgi:ubiquinone/menaquinone biosynthesis C-methylase UbiE